MGHPRAQIAVWVKKPSSDDEELYLGGRIHNLPGGELDAAVLGVMILVCECASDFEFADLTIHTDRLQASPLLLPGVPARGTG
ncbi:MAG: hypothetical protein ABEH64_01295 [Salinirussus sp.]